jgi:hypothetical protein
MIAPGAVSVGMHRQGYDQLTQYDERGWRWYLQPGSA